MANALLARLREAVATTDLPQLQRGTDLEESAPTQAERDAAVQTGDAFQDGSFPIRTQKQANDAWGLRGHNENHSEASIVAHIRKQVKKHGLTMPGGKTRESLHILIREAALTKTGNAYEVTIVREGPGNPGDRNYYTKQALREAVNKGLFEGLQAYLNHPTPDEERDRPERDVRYLAGHFREARYIDGNLAEVRAKFIPGGMDKDRVVALIESALESVPGRPLVGISIDGYGDAPDQQQINGRTYNMVREVTHLGSADIVTRAGAGGQFIRRLQEAWRTTGPAERRPDTSKEARMKPAKLQEKAKAAAAKLREAAGLDDNDDERAGTLIAEALTELDEITAAKVKTEVEIREVEKPVAASDDEKDQIAAKLATAETKLREAETEREQEKQRRKDAESERDTLKSSQLAAKVLREAEVPPKTAREWFDEIVDCDSEDSMKKLVERKKEARDEMLADLRESVGIEGAPARMPSLTGGTPSTGGLLERMGIDRDDLAARARDTTRRTDDDRAQNNVNVRDRNQTASSFPSPRTSRSTPATSCTGTARTTPSRP